MNFNETQEIIGLSTQGKILSLKLKEEKMDIKEFTKQQGKFLKAEDVDKSTTKKFIILTEGILKPNEKYGGERLHLVGELDQVEYVFDCSKTNARTIESILGSDTKKWIGKQIVLETYKTKTTEGKMTTAINVVASQTEKTKVVRML